MTRKKQIKPYAEMRTKELARATAGFDEEFVIDRSREPSADQKALWKKAKRKGGRPKLGKQVRVIAVSVERGLLDRVDRLAKQLKVPRTKLIALGLERVLREQRS